MKYFYENKGMRVEARYTRKLEFAAHLHAHIELALLLKGRSTVLVDSVEYSFADGDALMIFPNQVHRFGQDDIEECLICIFPPQICPELRGVFEKRIPRDPVIKGAAEMFGVVPILRRIEEVNRLALPGADILNRGYITALLGELFAVMELTDTKTSGSNTLRDIISYCQSHYTADIQLSTLAADLHMSRHYISHLFSDKLHMHFRDYIGMLRISEAQRLLRGGEESITDIAYQVGFNSTRSFNRTFTKHIGVTPSRYRREMRL